MYWYVLYRYTMSTKDYITVNNAVRQMLWCKKYVRFSLCSVYRIVCRRSKTKKWKYYLVQVPQVCDKIEYST